MLVFGCLLAIAAGLFPRLVLIIMWIVGPRINNTFDTNIWPLLGLIFLPYTTIMYVLVWSSATGVVGWDWLWIALGVWMDVMKWARIAENRKNIPGYSMEADDEEYEDEDEPPVEYTTSDELEKLAGLRDSGAITDEEFEAKKKQILEL
jgi:hypothetical protein